MASEIESHLLSLIESSDAGNIFSLFSDHLCSFSDLAGAKKSKSVSKQKRHQTLTIRSLAKQFLPFLNKSLSVLPKRLSNLKEANGTDETAKDLFDTFKLCLDCLELVSSQLSCQPYTVQLQRVRLIYCLEAWGWYGDAEIEGFRVLEKLRGSDSGLRKRNYKGKYLPIEENGNGEYAMVVVEVVTAIVKCVAMGQLRDGEKYTMVLGLLDEVKPWFRVLDANAYEKLQRALVTFLGKCALSLVREAVNFDKDLVRSFSVATVKQYLKSSLKDQIYKFARQIFSSLFALEEMETSITIDISMSVLRIITCEFQVETGDGWGQLVDLVSYFANKCRTADSLCCTTVSHHLREIAVDYCQVMQPFNLILRLYTIGLSIRICDINIKECEATSLKGKQDDSTSRVLVDDVNTWQNLAAVLGSLECYFHGACKQNCTSNSEAHISCMGKAKKAYLLPYANSLKFLCQPLADLINSEKRQIVSKTEVANAPVHLIVIQDAFHQFCDTCLFLQRCMPDRERVGTDYGKTMLNVAMAAFILSIRTQLKKKLSAHLVKEIIASGWIQIRELKYLFASLYNMGVLLYRNKQLIEASKALKICYRASWTCVGLLCLMFKNQSDGSHDDLSEEAIIDFVCEACSRCALFFDILQQRGDQKIKKFIVDSLENWSVAGNVIRKLPGPMPLVKQWVKMEYRLHKNLDPAESCATLYTLLSSSQKFAKGAIGKILEQELLAYEEMCSLCPNLSLRMQVEITDILLKDVYITEDTCLQRARVLIWKARATRIAGVERLRDCIKFLSEAVSIMGHMHHQTNCPGIPPYHQLAVAYCLRALCIQETEPNSKQIFQDISAALNIWLRIPIPDDCREDAQSTLPPENMIMLLYTVIDLLSMKGCTELHHDLYKLIFKIFKWKDVQLETCVALLWECRRLNHALCPSPINDAFISNLSEYCGEHSKLTDFWIRCMKVSKAQLIGFQQNFFFLHSNLLRSSSNYENTFQSDVTIDDVKDVASELVSSVPLPSRSAFLAGHLYYDLCERLISNGCFSEAISCAKEAHRLRTLIFQEKFKYCVEKQLEKYDDAGNIIETRTYGLKNFQVLKSIATEVWPCGTVNWDMNGYYLSPWNVLRCYLESTLQVGMVSELIGNGTEAETFLSWGKTISCSQSLLPFIVAFCSALGNLFRKKKLWDLAEKELQNAKKLLIDGGRGFSCSKCRLILEATLNKHLGHLSRSRRDIASENSQMEGLSHAISLFKTALDKLSCSVWKNTASCPVEDNGDVILVENQCLRSFRFDASSASCPVGSELDRTVPSTKVGPTAKRCSTKGRRSKNAQKCSPKEQSLVSDCGLRLTRSKHRSLKDQTLSNAADMQIGVSKERSCINESSSSDSFGERELVEVRNATLDICSCHERKCWQCLSKDVMASALLNNFICLKWEFCRRRLSSWVLVSLGKCLADCGEHYQAHDAIFCSIVALFSRDPFSKSYPPASLLLDFIGKEFVGDAFAVERAAILYNICWLTLKNYHPKHARIVCCDLSRIPLPKVVSWLLLAFVLSREVPILFQKVSRLLAALCLLCVSNSDFSLPFSCNELSQSHWASFFHQASLSTHVSYQFFSMLSQKNKSQFLLGAEGTYVTGSPCGGTEKFVIPRLAPDCTQDLVKFVKEFYTSFPCSTAVCISVLGGAFARLLEELTHIPSPVGAWLLLSRFNSKSQPVILLLPVDSLEDDDSNFSTTEATERKDLDKPWHCPWGFTVVDDVAPAFRLILEENYISSFDILAEDTKKNRSLWWTRRKKLDRCLGKLLRNVEDSWLGPWKHVLLGELSDNKFLDSIHKKLVNDLKSKCKVDVNETLLKVILGGGMDGIEEEACIAQLCLRNGCYIGSVGYCDEDGCKTPTSRSNGDDTRRGLALQLMHEAISKIEQEDNDDREPIILVLDPEVQMLPWENVPILRKQEVYRMPSVASISATLNRCHPHVEQVGSFASFPLIDPLDAFYLLNPGGDLNNTQVEFEGWFRDQNLEGKAGSAPTAEELAVALKSHDLFLYFGHGSGAQYISRHDVENLEKCAATFLMGCSSGSMLLNGCYIPQGIPLSYLLAGSPVVVANLWEVTDKDIDRFGKAMLEAWLRERSNSSEGCTECSLITKELAAMNIKGNTRKKSARKKLADTGINGLCKRECDHRRKVGSFMGQSREACNLPFLIGAAPVCYGVPTGIRRKK